MKGQDFLCSIGFDQPVNTPAGGVEPAAWDRLRANEKLLSREMRGRA
jgi:hypothetical protein